MKKNLCFFISLILIAVITISQGVEKVQLKNGLTLLLDNDSKSPVVSIQLWIRAGSIYENEKNYGLSHFLEHLVFKGTEKYSADVLSKLAETNGGIINAATSKEFTFYYIDIIKEEQKLALSVLQQLAFAATFPTDELERERPVVIEEIKRHEDNPGARLYDDFSQIIFPESNYHNRVIGSSEVIKNITREEIINYYRNFYRPENMILSISGNIADDLLKEVEETFSLLAPNNISEIRQLNLSANPGQLLTKKEKVTQGYFLAGWTIPKTDDITTIVTAEVVAAILGEGRASRFYQIFRERKRLVYEIGVSFEPQLGDSLFVISAIYPPEKTAILTKEINRQFQNFREKGIREEELQRAKQILKSNWLFAQETVHERSQISAYWSLLNNPELPQKYLTTLNSLNSSDINNFIKQFPSQLSGVIYVPEK